MGEPQKFNTSPRDFHAKRVKTTHRNHRCLQKSLKIRTASLMLGKSGMKTLCSNQRNRALTLLEVVIVLFILTILLAMFLPALAHRKGGSRINCANNLKQTGISFEIWAGDNRNKLPMEISITNGGAMESALTGNATKVFEVMSNELSTPQVLLCPKDMEHSRATNFCSAFTAKNISYFVGLDASIHSPNSILSGDSNLERTGQPITSGIHELTANTMFFWSKARHNRTGNILLADGSVQSIVNSNLVQQFSQTGLATNRIVIP